MEAKRLYIIGGPNGAGKTTASYSVLPRMIVDNSISPRHTVATGGIGRQTVIYDEITYKNIFRHV